MIWVWWSSDNPWITNMGILRMLAVRISDTQKTTKADTPLRYPNEINELVVTTNIYTTDISKAIMH